MVDDYAGQPRRAIVAGAGIGGLCAAIALAQTGWSVAVYEKAGRLEELGAGIVLAPNAMKALELLGAAHQVRVKGAAVGKAEICTAEGRLIVELPAAAQAGRHGTAGYLIHRSMLQAILFDRLSSMPGAVVRFGQKLTNWRMTDNEVEAQFEDGSRHESDILIGADGIRSAVAAGLPGAAHRPLRYGGFMALRMLPNLGQGGAQAMEDALMLAHCLSGCSRAESEVSAALLAYERNRIPRTSRIVRQSRRMAHMMQLEQPLIVGIRNMLLRIVPPDALAARLDWLIGYDITRDLKA